ncbi:MAG: hypothetical protein HC871_09345 [Rhizobiales bacterium]|nr:hypothetical protein [Hyphomicrobiales bacterium]
MLGKDPQILRCRVVWAGSKFGADSHSTPSTPSCRSCLSWIGRPGELFTLSTHAEASFDSRHYGPIKIADIVGVYRPLSSAIGGTSS